MGRKAARATAQVERERKFEGDAGIGAGAAVRLTGPAPLDGVAQGVAADTELLDAVYYDTPDRRLLSRRITLRRRTGGHDAGWHLKLPTADGARLELHVPLDAASAAGAAGASGAVPDELAARVRAYVREIPLTPVARLRTERHRTLLQDDADRTLVEIADDTVTAERLDPDGAVVGSSSWREVEAELVGGDETLLDAVEARLLADGLRRSASASKVARALGQPSAPRPHVESGRDDRQRAGTVGLLLTTLLRQQVDRLLACDAEVRVDAPDAVHQMRVAARRLRSTLRVYERLLRVDEIASVEEELRQLGRTLGVARDREVLGERLLRELAELRPEERPGPIRRRLSAWSRRGYRTAWRRATRELDGAPYFALLDALDALADAPPLRKRARRSAGKELPRMLERERLRVAHRVHEARRLPSGTAEHDAAVHAARRAAKRARYAGEGADQPGYATAMKSLQTLLGDRQDALLAAQALPELAATAQTAGEPGFGYGVLYARQQAAVAAAEAELPACWAAVETVELARGK
ncbi:CYTH and CHAD domain-containing protein [Streptacidiphilus fuscans]|uniref:CYTH and CHAD domain-containing protein n=1 Tax=Streptacidiphilus fuscans TaxID=2789292 RepID=A0A931B780_9ACTN|nr:CYTH and CHAD domain-containing protein [Streptacidiphilus fuscans]MBF9071694.1 CYTH and CHAD domain-containing protein [Streptacidiphilus fuscans]